MTTDSVPDWDNVLSYSTEDIATLLATGPSLFQTQPASPISQDWSNILRVEKRVARLQLHSGTLTEYCRSKRIPRGLRIQKAPTAFVDDKDFTSNWCAILNKCSLDLMILLIQTSNAHITQLKADLHTQITAVKDKTSPEDFQSQTTIIQDTINKLREDTKAYKYKKFVRDINDYQRNNVYQWLNPNTRTPKRVSFRNTSSPDYTCSSGEDSEGHGSSSSSSSAAPRFLDEGRQQQRGRGRPKRGTYGKPPPQSYGGYQQKPQTRSQNPTLLQ